MIVSEESSDQVFYLHGGNLNHLSAVLYEHLSMYVFALTMSSLLLGVLSARIGGQADTLSAWVILTFFSL